MYPVTEKLERALRASHRINSVVTVQAPGEDTLTVRLMAGGIDVDAASAIRRRGSLTIRGNAEVYEQVAAPGSLVKVHHGLIMGSDIELIPMFTGELVNDAEYSAGVISCSIADHTSWLSRCRFVSPYVSTPGTLRVEVIAQVVQTARPGTTVMNLSTDAGAVESVRVWTEGPTEVISDLTADGGTEAYFRADGVFVIEDVRTTLDDSVWTIDPGKGGVLKALSRRRPTDRLYNTVVVRPSATDGSQTWAQVVVQVTDPFHPRHPDKIGVVPYFWNSPTITNGETADSAGRKILDRVLGTTETLALEAIAHPALDVNDVVTAISPAIDKDPRQTFTHFVDGIRFDLAAGSMSLNTRNVGVVDE